MVGCAIVNGSVVRPPHITLPMRLFTDLILKFGNSVEAVLILGATLVVSLGAAFLIGFFVSS